jgi:GT2 family glycosyltransferase
LESLASQTFKGWEAVIVDNASTDGTADLVKSYSDRFPGQINHIRLSHNIGFPQGIKKAAEAAAGTYMVFMGDDDMLMPHMLEREVREFEMNPELGLVCSNAWGGERPGEKMVFPKEYGGVQNRALTIPEFVGLEVATFCTQSSLFKKAAFEKVGGFDLTYPDYQDVDLWFRLSTQFPVFYLPEPLAFVRIHAGNYSSTQRERFAESASGYWENRWRTAPTPELKKLYLWALCREEIQHIYFYLDDSHFDFGNFKKHVRKLWRLKKLHADWKAYYFGFISLLPETAFKPLREVKRTLARLRG